MSISKSFGQIISTYMEETRCSLEELSKKISLTEQQTEKLLQGRYWPTLSRADQICDILGIEIQLLVRKS